MSTPSTLKRLVLGLVATAALSAAAPAVAQPYSVFYIATNGNDSWNGLQATPGTPPAGPWKTLMGARNTIRTYRSLGVLADNTTIHVKILPGEYPMSSALILESQDSGTVAAPISFENYSTPYPVLTGGQSLRAGPSGPSQYSFTVVGGKWQLDRPELVAGAANEWQIEQLFVNGRRATRARTPNRSEFTEIQPPKGWLHHEAMPASLPVACPLDKDGDASGQCTVSERCFKLAPADYSLLSGLTTAQLHDVQLAHIDYWITSKSWIDHLEPNNIVALAGKLAWGALPPVTPTNYSRVELTGIPSALDAPGEFHVDRQIGRLRYYPLPGESPTGAVVIAPRMQAPELIDIQATSPNWVQYISFHNLVIQYTPYLLRRTWIDNDKFTGGYIDSYGGFSLPAAVTVRRGRSLEFDGLDVRHTGASAIWLRKDTEQVTVKRNYLHDLGGGGVKVVDFDPSEVLTCAPPPSPPPPPCGPTPPPDSLCGHTNFYSMVPMGGENVITNNVIHDGARSFYDTNGIFVVKSANNTISHNDVGGFFNSGIVTFSHRCDDPNSPLCDASHDNVIEENRVHQIGQDFLSDLGAFYSAGWQEGQELRENVLYNVRHFGDAATPYNGYGRAGYTSMGVYLDGGSFTAVHDNLVYDVETGGIFVSQNGERSAINNIFAFSEEQDLFLAAGGLDGPATITNNILYFRQRYAGVPTPCPVGASAFYQDFQLDFNWYWGGTPGSSSVKFYNPCGGADLTFSQWQDFLLPYGEDANSSAGVDPLFVDPTNWNFNLSPSSPALVYFTPFDVSNAGVDNTSPYYASRDELERPYVDFGGMYGFKTVGSYANPLYTGAACPPGYTDSRTWGTPGVDWHMGYCYRTLSDQASLSRFGGMYVTGSGYTGFNALAGVTGCPTGYTSSQVLGDAATSDPSVFFCYKVVSGIGTGWQFGGMYGVTDQNAFGYYLNPLAARRAQCPATFTSYQLINPTATNKALFYCGKVG